MSFIDLPPSYEESLKENQINLCCNSAYNGPNKVYYSKNILFADFIPWCANSDSNEDLNFLLLRVNDWLLVNIQYRVDKCEFIPRMIDSRRKLDLDKSYIFNLSIGRTYFVNQLRLHITVDKSKIEPDLICVRSYIPETSNTKLINMSFTNSCSRQFLVQSLVFEEMSSLIDKINEDIKKRIISGVIINISTFYSKANKEPNCNSKFNSINSTMFYTEISKPKCHLKSLRVFYKPGSEICGNLRAKSFIAYNNSKKLDDLIENAISFISKMQTLNFISMETFPEFEEENRLAEQNNIINHNSTFVYGERLIRFESIKVFYFTDGDSLLKPLQYVSDPLKILWIVPRKSKKTFENYKNFMNSFDDLISTYDKNLIDVETLCIPNSLTWSQVRHQTVMRYHNENCTNYQIYAFKIIIKNEKDCLWKNAGEPNGNIMKYVGFNSIL